MKRRRHQERIRALTARALDGYARDRAERERRRGRPPRPGDVFVMAETADFPVEWLVLERDPQDPDRLLAVAADLNPLAGTADVIVPAESAAGPLSIRCAFWAWLESRHFEPARRTGCVDSEALDRARRKRDQLAAGTLVGSVPEETTDGDPEYGDWLEVLEQARATLLETPRRRFFPPRRRVLDSPLAVAALVILAVAMGFLGGVVWRHREQAAMVNLPLALFGPAGTVRGPVETLTVPAASSHFLLIFEVNARYPAYRLEIQERGGLTPVWSSSGLTRTGGAELSVALPRHLLPPGEYELRLYGLPEGPASLLAEHALRLEVE